MAKAAVRGKKKGKHRHTTSWSRAIKEAQKVLHWAAGPREEKTEVWQPLEMRMRGPGRPGGRETRVVYVTC